jgi:hypothetical protein
VLVYRVDADIDTGMGPVTVFDSREDSGGCTRSPNVHAELSDATFTPGEVFRDPARKISVEVASADVSGTYRVRVTRG